MFFCLLETLTPASPQQIGMAHSQMRFLPAAWGEKKKVTHYNYSTWFTELSHLCSPTFPLISFGDLGKVYVHISVCVCALVRFYFSLAFCLFIYVCTKIKIPCCFSQTYGISFNNKFIDPWNLPLFSLRCESAIAVITEMHATLSMTVVMWSGLVVMRRWSFDFFVTK